MCSLQPPPPAHPAHGIHSPRGQQTSDGHTWPAPGLHLASGNTWKFLPGLTLGHTLYTHCTWILIWLWIKCVKPVLWIIVVCNSSLVYVPWDLVTSAYPLGLLGTAHTPWCKRQRNLNRSSTHDPNQTIGAAPPKFSLPFSSWCISSTKLTQPCLQQGKVYTMSGVQTRIPSSTKPNATQRGTPARHPSQYMFLVMKVGVLLARYNRPYYAKLQYMGSCFLRAVVSWYNNLSSSFIDVHMQLVVPYKLANAGRVRNLPSWCP